MVVRCKLVNGNRLARIIVIFFASFFVLSALIILTMPSLQSWFIHNCIASKAFTCKVSDVALAYWWLAVLPVMVIITIIVEFLFSKRQLPNSN